MNEQEVRAEAIKKIETVMTLAGLKGKVEDDGQLLTMLFQTKEDRDQVVHVRISGQTPEGKLVATVFSPCLFIKKGLFSRFSRDRAIELLLLNENLYMARHGLLDLGDQYLVVASTDLLVDTMDPEEFRATVWYVATAADRYEEKYGGDEF